MKSAKWWTAEIGGASGQPVVRCHLCPRGCLLHEGKSGVCGVRRNEGGKMVALSYGYPVAVQVDPVEKKPFSEFLPGTKTFSIGTFGCSLRCCFCQNAELSTGKYGERSFRYFAPEEIVALAERYDCRSVAFTYNEPTVFGEYLMDTAVLAREKGLKTLLVSNGFVTQEAAKDIFPLIDAANIDMKGFSEEFYRTMCGGSLKPVLESIGYLCHTVKAHVELTNLVIPGKNDSPEMIDAFLDWVETHLDKEIPLHFSAYFPAHEYHESPRTPPAQLHQIKAHCADRGFQHIYLGNI